MSIADWIGACVDPAHSVDHGPAVLALQEVGEVTCTLGEVRNRGDLIIFWGCDPVESHPRHLSRYSLEPAGLFVPRGRQDRYCVVVDVRETATAQVADQFIAIKPGKEFEALWALRALAKGVELDAAADRSRDRRFACDLAGIDGPDEAGEIRRDLLRSRPDHDLRYASMFPRALRPGPRHERSCSVRLRADGRATATSPAPTTS